MPAGTLSVFTATKILPRVTSDAAKDSEKDETNLDQFPEGGMAAWCTVVGAALVQFCCFGYVSSFGVYQEYYTLHHLTNESASAISWIGSVSGFLVCAFGLVAGALCDRGYCYHLIITGSFMQSFTLFMLSLAQPGQYYQVFLAQGVGLGFALGLTYVPSLAVISHHFHRRRTLAMSLAASGSSLGATIHPIMLNYMFHRSVGFANGVRISAAFVSVLLLISCLLIRTRLEPPRNPVSYLSVGRRAIRDIPFCMMSAGFLFFQAGFYFPLFYLQLDSIQHGNSETFSFYSLALLNGASLIGRVSTGFLTRRVSVPWLMIMATGVCGILILAMISLSGATSVVSFGVSYGYFSGIYIALLAPLVAFLTSDLSEFGARLGIGVMAAGIGALLGAPVSGALLTSKYEWWIPSVFDGAIALLGCFLLVMMQVVRIRREHTSEKQDVENKEA